MTSTTPLGRRLPIGPEVLKGPRFQIGVVGSDEDLEEWPEYLPPIGSTPRG